MGYTTVWQPLIMSTRRVAPGGTVGGGWVVHLLCDGDADGDGLALPVACGPDGPAALAECVVGDGLAALVVPADGPQATSAPIASAPIYSAVFRRVKRNRGLT